MEHRGALSRTVLVVGIDTIATKNQYQFDAMGKRGWKYVTVESSRTKYTRTKRTIKKSPSVASRLSRTVRICLRWRKRIHHAEIYVGGRLSGPLTAFLRVLGVRTVLVERGDLRLLRKGRLSLATRLSILMAFRFSHYVWYREPDTGNYLESMKVASRFYLPNAIPLPPARSSDSRDIDLLWVNRLLPERHPMWLISATARLAAGGTPAKAVLVGEVPNPTNQTLSREQDRCIEALRRNPPCEMLPFQDPVSFYRRARFFVLPADTVFCNFALLEAMSYGVVPVVSGVPHADELVSDGRNGLLADHSEEGLYLAIERALSLSRLDWKAMSQAARDHVVQFHNVERWADQLHLFYSSLHSDVHSFRDRPSAAYGPLEGST